MKNPDLIRSKDVAHLLDMSPDDVIALTKKGEIPGVKVGRYWRYTLSDITTLRKRLKKKGQI